MMEADETLITSLYSNDLSLLIQPLPDQVYLSVSLLAKIGCVNLLHKYKPLPVCLYLPLTTSGPSIALTNMQEDEASGGLSSISAMSITSAFTRSVPQVKKQIARLTCDQVNSGMQGLVLEAAVSASPSPACSDTHAYVCECHFAR